MAAEPITMPEMPQPIGYVILADGVTASDYALKHLSQALASAQDEYGLAGKTAENKFEGFRYVDLNTIIKAVRPHLGKHKLNLQQFSVTDLERKTVRIITRLNHWESGEWVQSELELPAEGQAGKEASSPKFNQKTIGAAITYGKKYAYKTTAGIADASDDDVDKEEGSADLPSRAPRQITQGKPQQKADGNAAKLIRVCREHGVDLAKASTEMVTRYGVRKADELTPLQFDELVKWASGAQQAAQ